MDSKRMNIGSKDFISNLPEALVGHILSFLPTKNAALTSVLSKRWRHMLAFVPNLEFDDEIYGYVDAGQWEWQEKRTSFQLFVDRVLALQGNASVNKFSLSCKLGVERSSSVNRWLSNVLERGVVDLDLYVSLEYGYRLPSEVLMSKTLVKLKVAGTTDFSTDVGQVSLPKLKTLCLDDVGFNDEGGRAAFAKLISGCHVLEELVIFDVVFHYCDFFLVSNPTLKRLKVRLVFSGQRPKNVSFDTPNLVYLEFTCMVGVKYPKVNFDSLVEANLNLRMGFYQNEPAGDATNLFMGICNVEILCLSGATLEVLAFCCKATPVFSNLIHLTIDTDNEVQWELLPKLLENCPNLETLVFRGLRDKDTNHCKPWEDTRTCLSSSPVKMLKVLRFGQIESIVGDKMDNQKEVIKYFLETMSNLEQVMIYYDTSIDDDPSILSTELQKLEEVALSKCKIQVLPDNISFS